MIKLTPSSLDRLAACPGSHTAEKDLPYEESRYASEGKLLHEYMANRTPLEKIPSAEHRNIIRRTRMLARAVMDEWGSDRWETRCTYEVECFLNVEIGCGVRLSSKIDWLARNGDRKIIIDYKFGRGDVSPAEENLQLRAYACAVDNHDDPYTATVVLVQPYADEPVQKSVYAPEDIAKAKEQIFELGLKAQSPNAPRTPGPHCKYCKAIGTDRCPESLGTAVALKPRLSDVMPTGQALADILDASRHVQALVDKIEAFARQELEQGHDVPGWTLTPNAPIRVIDDVQAAFGLASELMTSEEFASCCKVSLGDIESLLRDKRGLTWPQAKSLVNETLSAVIERRPKAPSLKKTK